MAVFELEGANSKMVVDTDAGELRIERGEIASASLPAQTVVKLSELESYEVKEMAFGNADKGSAMIKLVYPGAPDSNDFLMGATYCENMFQYKLRHQAKADQVFAVLKEAVAANK